MLELNEVVTHISTKTTLDPSTIHDLLTEGWTFVEELNALTRWEAPGRALKFNSAEETARG